MSRRRAIWLSVVAAVLLSLVLLGGALLTTTGLRLTLDVASRFIPGELTTEGLEGRLVGPLQAGSVHYNGPGGDYSLQQFALDWSPLALLQGRLAITRLHATNIRLALAPSPQDSPSTSQPALSDMRLPLRLALKDVRLEEVEIVSPEGDITRIKRVGLEAKADGDTLRLSEFKLVLPQASLAAEGWLGLARGTTTQLEFDWQATPPGLPEYAGEGRIQGDWGGLQLSHRLTRPATAQLQAEVQQPFGEMHWSLRAGMPQAALNRFAVNLPPTQVRAELRASGDSQHAAIEADLTSDHPELQGQTVHLEGRVSHTDWTAYAIPQLEMHVGDNRLQLTGNWSLQEKGGQLRLTWSHLQWPLAGQPALLAQAGQADWSGRLEEYDLALQSRLQGAGIPPGEWKLQGRGNLAGLELSELKGDLLDGTLTAQGRVDWQPQPAWKLQLRANAIDPGRHWPGWDGRVSAEASSEGRVQDAGLSASLGLQELKGTLRDTPVTGGGVLRVRNSTWEVEDLNLRTGPNRLRLTGGLDRQEGLLWELDFPQLQVTLPGIHGALESRGSLTGRWPQSHVDAGFSIAGLSYKNARIEQATGTVKAGLNDARAPLALDLTGRNWAWQGRQLQQVTANLSGSLSDHRFEVDATGQAHALNLVATGQWQDAAWQGEVSQLDWQLPETGAWKLKSSVHPRVSRESTELGTACWSQQQAGLCLQASADEGFADWRGKATLKRLPVNRFEAWLPPAVVLTSELTAEAEFDTGDETVQSRGRLRLSPGEVSWKGNETPVPLQHGEGAVTWQLDARGLEAQAQLGLFNQDSLTASLRLPEFQPGKTALAQQPVTATLDADIQQLEVVELFVEQVRQVQGRLHVDSQVKGTLGQPRIRARAEVDHASLQVPAAGIQVTDIGMKVESMPTGPIQLSGHARSGDGQIRLDGTVNTAEGLAWSADMQIRGKDFLVLNIPEARLPVSPDLKLKVNRPRIDLTGDIRVDQARLEPRDFSGAVAPSRDVVVVSQPEAAENSRWQVSSRVTLIPGDKVEFDGYGLVGRFVGRLEIIDEPGQVTRARGDLRVVDGTYTAYGQELQVEEGRILYSGGPIDNPAIDARAIRQVEEVTAGIRLSGYLQQPDVELFSKPPMSQADTLSYLMVGRPVSQASSSDGQLLMKAVSALGVKGGNMLAAEIGETLGLDEVSVESGETKEDTSLVLGKYLSPRLYVNYSIGLFETVNTLKLRYELSRRWTLETQVGTDTGGDLLYSIER